MGRSTSDVRDAIAGMRWAEAYEGLQPLLGDDSPDADELERLAVVAHLVGNDAVSDEAWELASRRWSEGDDPANAARCAFWLGFGLMLRGETARAGGWLARVDRLLGDVEGRCATHGYALVPSVLAALQLGDASSAVDLAAQAHAIGRSTGDPDLTALAMLCEGQASITGGDTGRGLRLLDETMVAVSSGEVSPIPTGVIYCAVIEACLVVHDLTRAGDWTDALGEWCDRQPDLVPYRGQCLVHRAQILQVRGRWDDAVVEARRACELLVDPPHPALGLAWYQLGELARLRGHADAAADAYRAASRVGHEPMPGLALLTAECGELDDAVAAIGRAVEESPAQPELLAAQVEILRLRGDVAAARAASEELTALAGADHVPLLEAQAAHAAGSVSLAEGDAAAALAMLRRAQSVWLDLDLPYDAARSRVLVGLAFAALGDRLSAELELDAARDALRRLDAAPDLARLDALLGRTADPSDGPLTAREREVLRLVSAGNTNRDIADVLVISEHTVARHLQNIFLKIDVHSRAAATAYAFEHDLV